MAMLLAMYQKMRLIREKNEATLDLTRFKSKYDRVSKNIERIQKMYTSKIATLDSQANMMKTRARSIFQQGFGLAMDGSSSYLNPGLMGGQNYFQQSKLYEFINNRSVLGVENATDKDGKPIDGKYVFRGTNNSVPLTDEAIELIQYALNGGNLSSLKYDKESEKYSLPDDDTSTYNASDVNLAQVAIQSANAMYQTTYMNCSNATSNYEQNVSIWLENAKAELEAQQDEAIEPLTYQQTMWELEKEQAEERLSRIKEELQAYRDLCKEECKDQAPKFGLG